jgi:hypothetical protein
MVMVMVGQQSGGYSIFGHLLFITIVQECIHDSIQIPKNKDEAEHQIQPSDDETWKFEISRLKGWNLTISPPVSSSKQNKNFSNRAGMTKTFLFKQCCDRKWKFQKKTHHRLSRKIFIGSVI